LRERVNAGRSGPAPTAAAPVTPPRTNSAGGG